MLGSGITKAKIPGVLHDVYYALWKVRNGGFLQAAHQFHLQQQMPQVGQPDTQYQHRFSPR